MKFKDLTMEQMNSICDKVDCLDCPFYFWMDKLGGEEVLRDKGSSGMCLVEIAQAYKDNLDEEIDIDENLLRD